jgi:hypothetical protein
MLAAVFTLTACVPDIDLAGNAWTSNSNYYEDGERVDTEFALVCTSTNSGTLFISITYDDEPMGMCLAMPFTYTWDDNHGTATATLEFPEDWKGRKSMDKGTYSFTINMDYTKTEGLVVTSSDIERMLGVPCTKLNLTKNSYAKPSAMTGTRWMMDFDYSYDDYDSEYTEHYRYELEFVSATAAVLNMSMTEDGDEAENMRWNVNYTYSGGVGRTSIYFDGETVKGGFYMTDDTHMTFTDGMNRLNLVKQ